MNPWIFCFFSFMALPSLFSAIFPLNSLKEANALFSTLDQEDLVLFDVDFTLIIPKDSILRCPKHTREYVLEMCIPSKKFLPEFLYSQIISEAKSSLVEECTPLLVKNLQERKVPTIAFTAVTSEKWGVIECFADFRIQKLLQLGFDFSGAFPKISSPIFLPKREDRDAHPLYKSGVLFSSKHPKGEVLKQFLLTLNFRPKKVVFIDDTKEFLESVEKVLEEMNIDFIGFHYHAAEKLLCPQDKRIVEYQFHHLGTFGKWLSDEEAEERLEAASVN